MSTPNVDDLQRVRAERNRASRHDGVPSAAHAAPKVEWDDVRPWPTLDGAALYGLAGDVVRILEPHTEADPAALLVTFLALFGNAVGPSPHVRVGAVQHPARLFACLVGETARARKGQSFAEVGSLFAVADPVWWEAARAGGLASGEGIIARVRDDDQHLVEKRALFYEPEFARTLTAAARDGSTLSAMLRDAWDSGRLAVTTRKDPLVATGAHAGVVAHVTLEELRARLTSLDIANGFANRFLFTCVRRSKKLPSGGTLDEVERRRLGERVGHVLEIARARGTLIRTPEAEALWRSVYENLPEPPGLVGAITARADAQLLRLSLEFALLDKAARIGSAPIEAALAVWRYAEASARHVFGGVLGSDLADRLLEELRAVYPKGLSREAQHALFNRHVTAAALGTEREKLVRLRLATERSEPSPGRHPWMLYALPKRTKEAKEAPSVEEEWRAGDLPSPTSLASESVGDNSAASREGREPGSDDDDPAPAWTPATEEDAVEIFEARVVPPGDAATLALPPLRSNGYRSTSPNCPCPACHGTSWHWAGSDWTCSTCHPPVGAARPVEAAPATPGGARLLALAERLGWSTAHYRQGHSVGGDEATWRRFAAHGLLADQDAVLQYLEALLPAGAASR